MVGGRHCGRCETHGSELGGGGEKLLPWRGEKNFASLSTEREKRKEERGIERVLPQVCSRWKPLLGIDKGVRSTECHCFLANGT